MTASRRGKSREGTALTIGVLLSIGIGRTLYFLTNDAIAKCHLRRSAGNHGCLADRKHAPRAEVTEKLSGQQRLIAEAESIEWAPGTTRRHS